MSIQDIQSGKALHPFKGRDESTRLSGLQMCGLRPRIVRQGCTFGRRLRMEAFLFRNFAQTIAPYTFPRSYCRTMQPIYNKITLESKLSRDFVANVHYLLYLCK